MIQINLSSIEKLEKQFVNLLGVLQLPSLKDVALHQKNGDGTLRNKQLKVLR